MPLQFATVAPGGTLEEESRQGMDGMGGSGADGNGRTDITVGGSDIALSTAQAANGVLVFSGALTANISVTVPDTTRNLWFVNCEAMTSSGAYTVYFKSVSGTGLYLSPGLSALIECLSVGVYPPNFTSTGNPAPVIVTAPGSAQVANDTTIHQVNSGGQTQTTLPTAPTGLVTVKNINSYGSQYTQIVAPAGKTLEPESNYGGNPTVIFLYSWEAVTFYLDGNTYRILSRNYIASEHG